MNELKEKELQKVAGGSSVLTEWPRRYEDGTHVIIYDISGKFPNEICRGTIRRHKWLEMEHDFDWLCEVLTDDGEVIEAYEMEMEIG